MSVDLRTRVDADQAPCDVAERVIEALGLAAAGSVPSR